jgi:tripartite-type tricarboxylate transporter receptor subunit TctC
MRFLMTLAAMALTLPAYAQSYPDKPITIVVPYTAGGGVDMVARMLAASLQARWGQTVVVDNRPGGNGNIAAQRVATAAPDGYTLLASAEMPLIMNQSLYSSLPYDPNAFVPVSIVSGSPMFLAVLPSLPVHNVKELMDYARTHPGDVRYGTPGMGTPTHVIGLMLESQAGITLTQVPYKGSSQALNDFLGGHINMLFAFQTSAGQYFNTEHMRVLAVSSAKRDPQFPDIPAMSETLPGFSAQSVVALVAAPGTPPAIARKISDAVADAIKDPAMKKHLEELGSHGIGNTPEETGRYLTEQRASWGKEIHRAGLKIE